MLFFVLVLYSPLFFLFFFFVSCLDLLVLPPLMQLSGALINVPKKLAGIASWCAGK